MLLLLRLGGGLLLLGEGRVCVDVQILWLIVIEFLVQGSPERPLAANNLDGLFVGVERRVGEMRVGDVRLGGVPVAFLALLVDEEDDDDENDD